MKNKRFRPTKEQRAIICHDGPAFVTACPGAGKTQLLTERACLLFQNVPEGRGVAFLSFSRAAISEIETRLRIGGLLPSPFFPSFVGTFDSFVWQFLVAPFGVRGSTAHPRLIADIADSPVAPFEGAHPLPLSCFCPKTGRIFVKASKSRGFDVSKKPRHLIQAYMTAAERIRSGFLKRGQLDFDQARIVALGRLQEAIFAQRLGAALAARFWEIIVDESQDCNPDDLVIIRWLRDSGVPVKMVCDLNQSIYSFRGGVTDHLISFSKTFPAADRMEVTGNFRSTPSICKAIAQLRPPSLRGRPDRALGRLKCDTTPVRVFSYGGRSVPASIGTTFCSLLREFDIDIPSSPIVAATRATAAAAAGQPRPTNSTDRSFRLAEAVTSFHLATEFSDIKRALDSVHQILLELSGRLTGSYHQYLADNMIDEASWRSKVISIVRSLRFDPVKHSDARGWHSNAKDLLSREISIKQGRSIAQMLRWNTKLNKVLGAVDIQTAKPHTIHSVKGQEFLAVCVVTTVTLKSILDFLQTGIPAEKAEDARKLYVAASRAEKLLVIAVPKSQSSRLMTHLQGQGATVTLNEI